VLFLGFLRVLEEWKKWEILYKKSYKIFIFYRYVRRGRLKVIKGLGIYIYDYGGGGLPAPLTSSVGLII
jgi:hypothetical protein